MLDLGTEQFLALVTYKIFGKPNLVSSFVPTYVKREIFLFIYGLCTTLMSLNAKLFFLIPVEPTGVG